MAFWFYWRPVGVADRFAIGPLHGVLVPQTNPDPHRAALEQHGDVGCSQEETEVKDSLVEGTIGRGLRLAPPTLFDLVLHGDQRAVERGADGLSVSPALTLRRRGGEVKQETLPTQTHKT